MAACTKLKLPLTVIGTGPDNARLKRIAGPTVKFMENVETSEDIAKLLGLAEAFILPNVDDFGIVAIEALSAGTPVIAFRGGGAMDYIKPGKNGLFFSPQTVNGLSKILKGFNSSEYTQSDIKKSASGFSASAFRSKITKLVDDI